MPIVRIKGTGFLAFVTDEDLKSGRLLDSIENHPKLELPKSVANEKTEKRLSK